MDCGTEPKVPERPAPGEPRSDEQKAQYVASLRGWGLECHDDVAGINDRKARYSFQYEKANEGLLQKLWPFGGKKVPE